MPRRMSFALTTEQVRRREKTVTRRLAWLTLKAGDRITAVVKAMGLKKGEKAEWLADLEIVSVRREPLRMMDQADCVAEGFPDLTPGQFVRMFCDHYGDVTPDTEVTRIEFKYLDPQPALPFTSDPPRQPSLF